MAITCWGSRCPPETTRPRGSGPAASASTGCRAINRWIGCARPRRHHSSSRVSTGQVHSSMRRLSMPVTTMLGLKTTFDRRRWRRRPSWGHRQQALALQVDRSDAARISARRCGPRSPGVDTHGSPPSRARHRCALLRVPVRRRLRDGVSCGPSSRFVARAPPQRKRRMDPSPGDNPSSRGKPAT